MLFVKKLVERAILPKKGSTNAAGYDLFSVEDYLIPSKGKQVVKTGIALACPEGTYARIAPRSGLAVKNFIDVGAGVIDEDYRGEICVLLFNFGENEFKINQGDRIAQMIIEYVVQTQIMESDNLTSTQRGHGGFGSTGIKEFQVNNQNLSTNLKEKLQYNNISDAWQELTILDLYNFHQEGYITLQQKQSLGEQTMKGSKKIFEVLQKNQGKDKLLIIQQLLEIENN